MGKGIMALAIHAPDYKVGVGAKSFVWVMKNGIGYRYAIYKDYVSQIQPGCPVVLLKKDGKPRRAEGKLVQLKPTGIYTKNLIQRFDVYIENLHEVAYREEGLNRCGVALIKDC